MFLFQVPLDKLCDVVFFFQQTQQQGLYAVFLSWYLLQTWPKMQINFPLLNVTGCWTITAEGTQSFMRSCKSRLRWQRGMCALSGECWSRDTRPRFAMPMAGRCFTSLLPKEKSDVCGCSWSMEVRGFYLFWVLLLKVPLEGSILLVNSVGEVLLSLFKPSNEHYQRFVLHLIFFKVTIHD